MALLGRDQHYARMRLQYTGKQRSQLVELVTGGHATVRAAVTQPVARVLALFWDSVNYLGLPTWAVLVGLLAFACFRRGRLGRQTVFWLITGVVALARALPFWQAITAHVRGIILRSPARLMYVVT